MGVMSSTIVTTVNETMKTLRQKAVNNGRLIIALSIVSIVFIINGLDVRAMPSASEKTVRDALVSYEEWHEETWTDKDEPVFLYYRCPEQDLTFDQVFGYMNDIHNIVRASIGEKSAVVDVYFPFSTGKFQNSYSRFEKTMKEYRLAYWQFYSSGAGIEYADVLPCSSADKNGKVSSFGVEIQLHFYPESKAYMKKLKAIVKDGKSKATSDDELAKFFYDYICENVDYELHYSNPSDDYSKGSSHDALMNGKGVCQDMAFLFYDFCTEAGIPVVVCINEKVNHAWNQVRLDGKWYYVDQTGFVKSKSNRYGWSYYSTKGQHIKGFDYEREIDIDTVKHSFQSKYTDPIYLPEVSKKLKYMKKIGW